MGGHVGPQAGEMDSRKYRPAGREAGGSNRGGVQLLQRHGKASRQSDPEFRTGMACSRLAGDISAKETPIYYPAAVCFTHFGSGTKKKDLRLISIISKPGGVLAGSQPLS